MGISEKLIQLIKPKRHLASFQSLIGNPIIWVLVTIGILLLAYVSLSPLPIISTTDQTENTQKTFSKIKIQIPEKLEIAKEDDVLRSEQYRATQIFDSEVDKWLDKANQYQQSEHYVEPPEHNAWFAFQQALKIDADNLKAKIGLGEIETFLFENIELSFSDGDYELTEYWLQKFDIIAPKNEFQQQVRNEIKRKITLAEQSRLQEQQEQQKAKQLSEIESQINVLIEQSPIAPEEIHVAFETLNSIDENYVPNEEIQAQFVEKTIDLILLDIDNKRFEKASTKINILEQYATDGGKINQLNEFLALMQQQEQQHQAKELARAESILNATSSDNPSENTNATLGQKQNNRPVAANSGLINNDVLVEERSIKISDSQLLRQALETFYLQDNYVKAAQLFAPLARRDNLRAQFYLGLIDRYIVNTEIDNTTAEEWLSTSTLQILERAHQGQAWAQFDAGLAYDYGISLRRDPVLATKWYQQARAQGYSLDKSQLSRFFPLAGPEFKK